MAVASGEEEPLDPGAGRIIGAGANHLQQSIDQLSRNVAQNTQALKADTPGEGRAAFASRTRTANQATMTTESGTLPNGNVYSQRRRTVSVPGITSPQTETFRTEYYNGGSRTRSTVRTPYANGGWGTRERSTSYDRNSGLTWEQRTTDRRPNGVGGWETRTRTTSYDGESGFSWKERTTGVPSHGGYWDENDFHGMDWNSPPGGSGGSGGSHGGGVGRGPNGGTQGGGGGRGRGGGPSYTSNRGGSIGAGVPQLGMPSAGQIFTAWMKSFKDLGDSMLKPAIQFDNYAQWAGIVNGSPIGSDGTSGSAINALRKQIFGSNGQHTTLWAQSANDASKAAFIASQNSGFLNLVPGTRQANPQFSSYLGNIKDLALVNPTMDAASLASAFGPLTSARGYYASTMFGYTPALGPNGQIGRNAIGDVASSIFRKTMNGRTTVSPQELAASLGQNGYLNANIQAYVKSAGGDQNTTTALENYIRAQNTASLHGMSQQQFTSLMNQYEAGGSAGDAAAKKLQAVGITNSILQSQKNVKAANNSTTNDLLDQFGPALKNANEALTKFTNLVNGIVNTPGIKQMLGAGAGWSTVFGGLLGSLGGGMLMRGLAGRLAGGGTGSLLGAGGLGEGGLLAGGAGGLLAGAMPVATGALGGYGIEHFGHQATSHIKNSRIRNASNFLVDTGSGAAVGAGIGSVVPGIGTGIGAAIGGLVGAGWNLFNNYRSTSNDGRAGGAATKSSSRSSGGSSSGSGQPITGKTAAGAIEAALSELGKPYHWGGTGPDAFDCSGLMQYAYQHGSGISLPRTSEEQMNVGSPVKDLADARPGDLMFPNPGHVVMYLGNNKIVEAPHTGANVRIAPVSEYGQYQAIRRVAGAVGNYSSDSQTGNTQTTQTNKGGGNSGSPGFYGDYGSVEEVTAIAAAIAGTQGVLNNQPMGNSASDGAAGSASAGNYNWGAIKGKAGTIPAPPAAIKNAILGAMAATHVSGSDWARGLTTIAYRESSYDPKAVNNSDSNAAAGTPSEGLGQTIGPTFENFRVKSLPDDIFNPEANMAAVINYINSRYHGIRNVQQANPDLPPKGYAVGAWEIPQDHVAMVHKGEMIIEKPKADTIRQALMRDVVNVKDAATGQSSVSVPSGGVTLNFHSGAVQLVVPSGGITVQQAQQAAEDFAHALEQNARMKQLAKGL